MAKVKLDLSKIEYRLKAYMTTRHFDWEFNGQNWRIKRPSEVEFSGFDFFNFAITKEEGLEIDNLEIIWSATDSITYIAPGGIRGLSIIVKLESIIKEGVLVDKEGIYQLLSKIFMNNVSYSVNFSTLEITEFGDPTRKYLQSPYETNELMTRYFVAAVGEDICLQIKIHFDLPINFEDIENSLNVEVREQALKKFGYERFIKEGFEKDKIGFIITEKEKWLGNTKVPEEIYHAPVYIYNSGKLEDLLYQTKEECIIKMFDAISFLKVQDTSTGKTYFLKIPPDIQNIQEAKAWTFGLTREQYKPLIET